MNGELLKLLAKDEADIQVIAAVLQDAIAPVSEMKYLPAEKNFVLVVQRFCWDCAREGADYQRIETALDIEGVENVQFMGFDPAETAGMLELLTITIEGDALQLVFAGEARLKLKVGDWTLKMRDFGEPWPTTHKPSHVT